MAGNAVNTADMCKAVTKVMASPLTPEKRPQSNGHASPTYQKTNQGSPSIKHTDALTPPTVTEKKTQTNGHASPSRHPANTNSHADSEGYLKTDDRMRLAKERREERERSLGASGSSNEEITGAQLENKNKSWAWGPNSTAEGDWENAPPPHSAASALPHDLAAPSPAAIESGNVPSSPHKGSPSRRRTNPVPTEEYSGALSAPNTPKKERQRKERRTGSPATGSPVRRAKSPADVSHRSASPATSKLLPKSRTQSPCTVRQYPPSPMKHRPATPVSDSSRKTEDRQAEDVKNQDPKEGRSLKAEIHQNGSPNNESLDKAPKMETAVSSTPPPERRTIKIENHINGLKEKKSVVLENQQQKNKKLETPEKKPLKSNCNDVTANKCADPGRVVAGTTDAEEGSRLLAERRRLARVLKEQEEKQCRESEEQEKLKSEQLKKRQLEERARQEEKTCQAEEEKCRQERERKKREQEEKKHKEKELQALMEKEDRRFQKEKTEIHAQKDAECQQQERELFKQQEEQERQQRKKRIEEIMKRTRKGDGEMKREDSPEPLSPVSHPVFPPGGNQVLKTNLRPTPFRRPLCMARSTNRSVRGKYQRMDVRMNR